jgi:tetratricopeptide (TPR) repeat protein
MHEPEAIADLARAALEQGEEEGAIPTVLAAAQRSNDPRLWQWAGLLNRSLDDHATALQCFAIAARFAPADAKIAHGHAHVALEAGTDAVALFEHARALAPADPAILMGLNAARVAALQADVAVAELEAILDAAPLWVAGHLQLAEMRSLLGEEAMASASLDRAIVRHPNEPALWLCLCDLHRRREAYGKLLETVHRAEADAPNVDLGRFRAIAAGELGDPDAERLLSAAAVTADPALAISRIRYLLRSGQAAAAAPLIERELATERSSAIWPYAATAWRLLDDPRCRWLEDQPVLISVRDISSDMPPIASLVSHLRSLHERSGQFMDQSVRGGSQTDGPLLSRIDPLIRELRRAIIAAVEHYVAQLPPVDADHPLLRQPRDRRIRFSGSWSVRLRGGGFHANHVHPQGAISSALYLALPERAEGDPSEAGWLVLGEPPRDLGLDLPPHTKIEPKAGRLALFPSWMWHGTRPFAEGERMTVAFDVAPLKLTIAH